VSGRFPETEVSLNKLAALKMEGKKEGALRRSERSCPRKNKKYPSGGQKGKVLEMSRQNQRAAKLGRIGDTKDDCQVGRPGEPVLRIHRKK